MFDESVACCASPVSPGRSLDAHAASHPAHRLPGPEVLKLQTVPVLEPAAGADQDLRRGPHAATARVGAPTDLRLCSKPWLASRKCLFRGSLSDPTLSFLDVIIQPSSNPPGDRTRSMSSTVGAALSTSEQQPPGTGGARRICCSRHYGRAVSVKFGRCSSEAYPR